MNGYFSIGTQMAGAYERFCSEIKSKNKSDLERNDQTGIILAVIIKIMWGFFCFFNDSPVIFDIFTNMV